MNEPVTVYLGLGANLGDREDNIRRALTRLGQVPGIRVLEIATLRETEPVGGPEQGPYLNTAARIETRLAPEELLSICKLVERELGREEGGERYGPRPIDIDILFYGEQRIDRPGLMVPHPRLREREFVTVPLGELGVDLDSMPRPEPRPMIERDPRAFAARCDAWRRAGASLGLVPTMGALHAGHRSLLARARADCDRVVATIFVNPKQFGPGEDLDRYPRTLERDLELCAAEGVDLVFAPSVEDLYVPGFCSSLSVGAEADSLEGALRPGHFEGVATVVARLWILAHPDKAYFGRKDAQQVAVLSRLHRDLGLSGELIACETLRESDGLAMSSRNAYLSASERESATALFRAMRAVDQAMSHGERRVEVLREVALAILRAEPRCEVEYVELRRDEGLLPLDGEEIDRARMLIAVRVGKTRLIDNATLGDGSLASFGGEA